MRAALAAPPVLAFVLPFVLALTAKPAAVRADRRADIAALCDVSDGSAPAPITWQASRVVDSFVLAGRRLTRGWSGDGGDDGDRDDRAAPPRLALREARVDRTPPRRRRAVAPRAAPLLAQR